MCNKYLKLTEHFFPKSSDKNFYLSNLTDGTFISEPYKLSQTQFNIVLRLTGDKCVCQINQGYDVNSVKKFLNTLSKIGALENNNKIFPSLRTFSHQTKEPHLRGIHLEITNKCNLNCLHCYQKTYFKTTKNPPLRLKEIFSLIKEMETLNVINASISGGEPLMYKGLEKIFLEFEKKGIKIGNIFSNGILFNKEIIKSITQKIISKPHVIISLDGHNAEMHGLMRGINSKQRKILFDQITKNIKKLSDNGVVVKINTSVNRHNLECLPKIYELVKEFKVKMWRLAIPKYAGAFIENKDKISLDFKKNNLKEVYLKLIESFLKDTKKYKNKIVVPLDLRISNAFKTEMLVRPIIQYSPDDSTCQYTNNRISIKHNGDVTSCSMLTDFIVGNIKEKSLSEIWYSEQMQKLKHLAIKEIDECNKCEYASICGAGCRVNSWYAYKSIYKKDEDTCACFNFFHDILKLIKKHGFKVNLSKQETKKIHKKIQISGTNFYM